MRTLETSIDYEIGDAKLGQLKSITNYISPISLNQLIPYISGNEDLEVVLKNPILVNSEPFELNGFKTKQILSRASSIGVNAGSGSNPYLALVNESPSLMSFPSEVMWLSVPDGIEKIKQNIDWILQKDYFSLDCEKSTKIAEHYGKLIELNYQKYSLWSNLTNNYEGKHLFSLLMEISIELALQAKMKFLAGITPVINQKASNSIELSNNVNMGYGSIIADREDYGYENPGYFYTINLNSSVIKHDNYSNELKHIVSLTGDAMSNNLFDGIYLSVRGLEEISDSDGRVASLSRLIRELSYVAHDERLPLWLSRFGIVGLATFDLGACYSSYTLNMNMKDVFSKGGGNSNDRALHGKVLDRDRRRLLNANQIEAMIPYGGLPSVYGFRGIPTKEELLSSKAKEYRTNYSKPLNIAAMTSLAEEWQENIKSGEMNPGKEYIKTFSEPNFYSTWGCD